MRANYLDQIRKSYSVTVFVAIFTNLMVFGQPLEQRLLNHRDGNTATTSSKSATNDYSDDANSTPTHSEINEEAVEAELAPTAVSSKNALVFQATEPQAVIGLLDSSESENPYDNFFSVSIPKQIMMKDYDAFLVYELYGVSEASSTTKSINNNQSFGGKTIQINSNWTLVTEKIPATQLQSGSNEIYFNRRVEENYQYKVKNLRIQLENRGSSVISLNTEELVNNNGTVNLVGNVSDQTIKTITAFGKTVQVMDGVFEEIFTNVSPNVRTLKIGFATKHNQQAESHFAVNYKGNKVDYHFENSIWENNAKRFSLFTESSGSFQYSSLGLEVDTSQFTENKYSLTAEGLQFKDIKTINEDIENVTEGKFLGYRLKTTAPDSTSVQLRIKYDASKIPAGYTSRDVRIFAFDKVQKNWKALAVDSLDTFKQEIIAKTFSNDTDYINGVIKVPESPETGNFTPTTLSDMKFADPASGVVSIQPPSPNNTGTAATSFPIKLPAGRNGMQPSLQVSYNSEGGNGWMGLGWNISTQAITLNTKWGSPLFNAAFETEMYSLNGADLVLKHNNEYTSPHRQTNINRISERTFYERKEGSFQKIIRHGSGPTNYSWEVIDKMGNKSFYGGSPTTQIKEGTNIAHWALRRTEDPYGNYIEYIYSHSTATIGTSAVVGQKFHIDTIRYTRHSSNPNNYYEVAFVPLNYTVTHTGYPPSFSRTDAVVNAKNGYIHVINDVLKEVHISLIDGNPSNPKLIRKYRFDYKKGVFEKPLLERISEFDAGGKLFYSNTMEYYVSPGIGTGANPGVLVPAQTSTYNGNSDDLPTPSMLGPLGNLLPTGTTLGTSTSNGFSGGLRLGFGLGLNTSSVSNTIGGSFNYSKNTQNTKISFIDLNGDGLPDKVYQNGNIIYYRKNNGSSFMEPIFVSGIGEIGKTISRTSGAGIDANALGQFGIGKSWSKTKSDTDHYFTDFNGDGLPDMVTGGRVKFNVGAQDNSDIRSFTTDAALSENPIISGAVDSSIIPFLNLPTLPELRDEHPQFDHVKIWKAPYSGSIIVNTFAKLINKNVDSDGHTNTFRLTIERANNSQTTGLASTIKTINLLSKNQTDSYTSPTVTVTKGDTFFFRVHNLENGYGGEVQFDQTISYVALPVALASDDNGKDVSVYNSTQDYIMNNGGGTSVTNAALTIQWNLSNANFAVNQYSDKISFIIKRTRINTTNGNAAPPFYTKVDYHPTSGLGNIPLYNSVATSANYVDNYEFLIESPSNVKWQNIKWKPTITQAGEVIYPAVDYQFYDENVYQNKYYFDKSVLENPMITGPSDSNTPFMAIKNDFTNNLPPIGFLDGIPAAQLPIELNWVVKGEQQGIVKRLHSQTIYFHYSPVFPGYKVSSSKTDANAILSPAQLAAFSSFNLTKIQVENIRTSSLGKIYSAFYVSNRKLALGAVKTHTLVKLSNPSVPVAALQNPFFASTKTFYGATYRGWSQFLYNGGISFIRDNNGDITNTTPQNYSGAIDIALFDLETNSGGTTDVDPNTNSDGMTVASGAPRYTFYKQVNQYDKFENKAIIVAEYGPKNGIITAQVGRFGEGNLYDIYVDPSTLVLNGGSTFVGMRQRSESNGSAVSGNFFYGSATESEAASRVLSQYIDLNGDRYPDMVTEGLIQYTNMTGGLSNVTSPNSFSSGDNSNDTTLGATIPGLFAKSTEVKKTNTDVSSGINASTGFSKNSRQWIDMNGDGLTDRVLISESAIIVDLNKGYGFTAPITWGSGPDFLGLVVSTRSNVGAGPSFSFGSSFAAGFGAANSTANGNCFIVDVNGDSLPDFVKKDGNTFKYYLNTGTGFSGTSNIFHNGTIDQDYSIAGNIFGSVTFGFPIPLLFITLKVVFSPTLGVNASVNEKRVTIQDIDGDGYNDVVSKGQNNTNVTVRRNIVGETNLLKKVNLPLGGSWTINYERTGNTYNLSSSKWVLSKIVTHDGFTGDTSLKPDTSLTTAKYSDPFYDRRERDFFGFAIVEIEQRDPSNNTVYRTSKKLYHTENYYLSGIEKESQLLNQSNQILSQQQTLYNLLDRESPSVNFNATPEDNFLQASLIPSSASILDKSSLFIAVAEITSTSFEDGLGLTVRKEFNGYDNSGNVKTYTDLGDGASDAFRTELTYSASPFSPQTSVVFPEKISVFQNSDNTLLRERNATYNNKGKLEKVTTKLNQSENATVEMKYDSTFGNLIKVEQMDNKDASNANHFSQNIAYDSTVKTYPVSYQNSFGETSTTVYDYRFGMPIFTTDMNLQSMRTRIDNRGRVFEVTGPNELALENTNGNSGAWTIRMEYKGESIITGNVQPSHYNAIGNFVAVNPLTAQPTNSQHYAVTRHFDSMFANAGSATSSNQLITISIVDGFAQPLLVKKTHKSGTTAKWLLSGKEKKDAFGRTTETFLSTTQVSGSLPLLYVAGNGTVSSTIMEYDVKDRVKSVKQPGETLASTTQYKIEDGFFVNKVTNELGQTMNTFTDVRGRNRKTVQNGSITTTMNYNAINELMSVTDNGGFITSYIYDLGGRKLEMQHPDRGVVTFKYDKASRMTSQSNSNLFLSGGETVDYKYDYNRLVNVIYPKVPQNNIEYIFGKTSNVLAVSENAVGRLLQQNDASGVQVFGYGRMGEVTKNLRSVSVAGYQSFWFFTQWTYDSWNRVRNIVYPDQESVAYNYDTAGQLLSIKSTIPNFVPVQDVVSSISYNDYGERSKITYGNGTFTTYNYDNRRRMNVLKHSFIGFQLEKKYKYDELSNITDINTLTPQSSLPASGQIGGPVNHSYKYDNFNRLMHAEGNYIGANDLGTPYLQQKYILDMEYNTDHTIKRKTQVHNQGLIGSYGATPTNVVDHNKTTYTIDYSGYATGGFVAGQDYGYQQPHAARKIVEMPSDITDPNVEDARIKRKAISYDANGNQLEVSEKVGEQITKLRTNLWDEENRLMAVDLKPDEITNHPIAIYTYNAGGERTIRYNLDHLDVSSNSSEIAEEKRDNIMIYPNGLIMGKVKHHIIKGIRFDRISYTKHYYAGAERVSAKTGTVVDLGQYPSEVLNSKMLNLNTAEIRTKSNQTVQLAGQLVVKVYNTFELSPPALDPFVEGNIIRFYHDGKMLNIYYFHPDHLGSSSYISNAAGTVSQHMEYLPFGETLVDEHTNSFNSPFKFNGKELDEETGNYYYSARYYDPKWSIFISVDPLAEKYPSVSPYVFCLNNPIKFVDLDGKEPTPYEAAIISAHVYGDSKVKLEGGWAVSNAGKGLPMVNASGLKSAVYQRTVDGKTEYTYATAGTENGKDWENNGTQLVGASKQYKESRSNAEALKARLGDAELTFTGHSLGGGLAEANAIATDGKALTFNAAGISIFTSGLSSKSDTNAYIMITDPLNAIQQITGSPTAGGQKHWLQPRNASGIYNGHSIYSIIDALSKPTAAQTLWNTVKDAITPPSLHP